MTWSDALREQNRRNEIRVLFVGDSPPDPGDSERRFFYSPTLFPADNLFRRLMRVVIRRGSHRTQGVEPQWLERFEEDGFWLVDLTDKPVNHLSDSDRRRVRLECATWAQGTGRPY